MCMDCASELTALVSAEKTVGGRCLPNVVSPTRWECRTDDSSVRHDVLPAFARKIFARFQSRFVALLSMIRVSSNWRQIQKEAELYVYTQITDIYK